jgi:hypothetical protein
MKIKKTEPYKDKKIILNLDIERVESFNKGEEIEITPDEFEKIGIQRWLEIIMENKDEANIS